MNSDSQNRSYTETLEEDPGAYPVPFSFGGVELGSRLGSIRPSLRYWAVDPKRTNAPWYNEILQAHNKYEDWLSTLPPGQYPMPFGREEGKRMDEVPDSIRYWGVHPGRSSAPWYNSFVRANARYEQHLAAMREPGDFPFPPGVNKKHTGKPIKDVFQDDVWWALRPSNRQKSWYQPLYRANKRMLDDIYKTRSPGSEPIWFGTRYRGLRLDQVYQRKSFLSWCFDPKMNESGWICRLKDLVQRLEEYWQVHPERGGPRRHRKVPNIQNPVGEPIGPWDGSPGSAGEDDDYDKDSFVQSDSEELEYASGGNDDPMDDGVTENDGTSDSDESSAEMELSPRKRRRTNVVLSDKEPGVEVDDKWPASKLGKHYRVPYDTEGQGE